MMVSGALFGFGMRVNAITFDTGLLTHDGLRSFAMLVLQARDAQDGHSAAMWQAFDNLASAVEAKADVEETKERGRIIGKSGNGGSK